ncbi:cysteine desulfurase-like protein [Agrococcus citreus]|uniref:Cysteine desulfurase-like protein n=1 Tax=Agrococcus citreus TaxID=84643 RepID=A0ABN1YNV5_9MICO
MTLDVAALRARFPSLASGIAHFDGPGGTQTPAVVGEAIARTLTAPLSNRGTVVASERNADTVVREFRAAIADLVGGAADGVVYGRSATQLTYDFSRALAKSWGPGDEIVVTQLDHDANVRPWIQAADAVGATVRWLELDPTTADLDLSGLDDLVTDRTRLVAVTGASNLLGTKPDVARIARRAHEVGALVWVDGVHLAAHAAVDVAALGADLFVCSPYKFFGPHCAAVIAEPALLETIVPDKLLPSSNAVPERFELGTLPYELMAGATAAVDFIASLSPADGSRRERIVAAHHEIDEHERRLRARIEEGIARLGDRIALHSIAVDRTPTLFLTFRDRDAADAYPAFAERDILAPAGSFYAVEPFRALGLDVDGGLRVGLAAYNDDSEIDRLLAALEELVG